MKNLKNLSIKNLHLKSAVAFFFLFFLYGTSIGNGLQGISYNVWWLGEVPPCRMFKYSTKACGGILPNHCYKPFLLVWLNNLI